VSMRAHKRGGVLLVVPAGSDRWRESIVSPISYELSPRFSALEELMSEGTAARDRLWEDALGRAIEGIAGLTAVDGATILTDRLALLAFGDTVKPTAREAIASLKAMGIRSVLVTGDNAGSAAAVAARLGIDEVHAQVLPDDKARTIRDLKIKSGGIVAMAGDGINDAPALAAADVGIAMGTGTDVAMNSAQVTLVKGDLRGIATARALSSATIANMKQNLAFAFVYNALGIPLAAGLLFPITGWLLSPMVAALAMSLSSASVIFNALRLRNATIGADAGDLATESLPLAH